MEKGDSIHRRTTTKASWEIQSMNGAVHLIVGEIAVRSMPSHGMVTCGAWAADG